MARRATSTSTDGDTQEEEEATPEDVVVKFFRAIEKQDAKALVGLFDPDSLDEIKYALGNEYRSLVGEYFFGDMPEDVKFKNLKFDTDIDGKEAVVDLIKGKVVYTDEYGDEATEDLMDSEDTVTFYLVKVKGEWYISIDTFPDLIAEYDIPETETETGPPTPTPARIPTPILSLRRSMLPALTAPGGEAGKWAPTPPVTTATARVCRTCRITATSAAVAACSTTSMETHGNATPAAAPA